MNVSVDNYQPSVGCVIPGVSITVPGQSSSVREILDKYRVTGTLPESVSDRFKHYDNISDPDDYDESFDVVERLDQLQEVLNYEREQQAQRSVPSGEAQRSGEVSDRKQDAPANGESEGESPSVENGG